MEKNNVAVHSGVSLTTVLLVVFITLKLTGVITWSWWIVLIMPFAIDLALALASILVIVLIIVIAMAIGIKPKN